MVDNGVIRCENNGAGSPGDNKTRCNFGYKL